MPAVYFEVSRTVYFTIRKWFFLLVIPDELVIEVKPISLATGNWFSSSVSKENSILD